MVALVIIYNHRYDSNIPKLEAIYGDKFSHIFHLVPFYEGDKENVITVYDNSYYFHSYISQAYSTLKNKGNFTHTIFVADDLILNPQINENNYKEIYKISSEDSFFPMFLSLAHRNRERWSNLVHILYFKLAAPGLEIKKELPSRSEILKKFEDNGVEASRINLDNFYTLPHLNKYPKTAKGIYSYYKKRREIKTVHKMEHLDLEIPLTSGFSDHLVISNSDFGLFSRYCGIFSATRLFVEFAIPTALLIACKNKIRTEEDIDKKGITYWLQERDVFEKKYDLTMSNLLSNFPDEVLFYHPVKLSKWK